MIRARPLHNSWESLNARIESCQLCSRLRGHCEQIAITKRAAFRDETYWAKPVPNFGDPNARMLIVGLAPAAHGANRTGRMFTGDRSGEWLYRALHKAGFANQPSSEHAGDRLRLIDCAITATCHCAPPDNKPTNEELAACRPWLSASFDSVPATVFVALGQIAWKAAISEARERNWWHGAIPKFAHLARVSLGGDRWLVGSYHPSQQNTFTGKLTQPMFDQVFQVAKQLVRSR